MARRRFAALGRPPVAELPRHTLSPAAPCPDEERFAPCLPPRLRFALSWHRPGWTHRHTPVQRRAREPKSG